MTEVVTHEIPDRPWLRLEEAEAALLTSGIVKVVEVEHEGERYLSGDAQLEISKIFSEAGFAGSLKFMGRPTAPYEAVSHGDLQDIPIVYFRKERSFYGSGGIGHLSFEPTENDLAQEAIDLKTGNGDGDWQEVLVGRDGLLQILNRNPNRGRTGAPGRPTSMHLVEIEFRRRFRLGQTLTSNGAEAEHLEGWLKAAHPSEPQLTAKTIVNRLAPVRRNLENARN